MRAQPPAWKFATCVAAIVALMVAVLAAPPVMAARKRAKPSASLKVAVLPFDGRGAGGSDVKEALELELELAENASVAPSGALERELAKLDADDRFEQKTLAAIMKRSKVDVVVHGSRGPGQRTADALVVAAYAADGKPHFVTEMRLGTEPDVAAAAIGSKLREALRTWKELSVVPLPGDAASSRVVADDVLADEDREEPPPRVVERDTPPREEEKEDKEEKKALDFNEPSEEPAARATPDSESLDGDADEDTSRRDRRRREEERPRRSRLDDEAPPEEEPSKSQVDEQGRLVDEPEGTPRVGHVFVAAASFRGSTWQYAFSGSADLGTGPQPVATGVSVPFVAGGGLRADFWPIRWVGVDAEAHFGAMRLVLQNKSGGAEIAPREFTAYQLGGAAALKGRYVFDAGLPGLGIGGRLGYRYWGSTTETQTAEGGAQVTVVPGFAFHSLVVGAELGLPFVIAGRLLEIDLRLDSLPATYYEETPDNPGQSSLAFGWSGSLLARYLVTSGFFIEIGASSQGALVNYQGSPAKPRNVLAAGNQPVPLAGGEVRNFAVGFELGVGWEL